MENISFGYSPLEKPLISDFNLHAHPGEWIAVVGASGSGKSTIAKVITGLYEEWGGTLSFDGVPRRKLPRKVILSSLAAVDQDIFLISGTVAENISLFDNTVLRSEIVQWPQWEAVKIPDPEFTVHPSQIKGRMDPGSDTTSIQSTATPEIENRPGSAQTTLARKGYVRQWISVGKYDMRV